MEDITLDILIPHERSYRTDQLDNFFSELKEYIRDGQWPFEIKDIYEVQNNGKAKKLQIEITAEASSVCSIEDDFEVEMKIKFEEMISEYIFENSNFFEGNELGERVIKKRYYNMLA